MSRFQGSYNSQALVGWAVTILGLLGALYIGKMVAGENFKFLAMVVVGIVAMTVVLSIGRYYWLLIPVLSGLTGSISILPVPFNYAELGTIAAIGLFVVHVALKKTNLGYKLDILDFVLVLNMAWLVVTYLRNPIGFRISGGDMIGGRDYVNAAMAVGGYFVLCHSRVGPRLARFMPLIIAVPIIAAGLIMVVTQFFPPLGRAIYPFYSGVSIADFSFSSITSSEGEYSRLSGFQGVGSTLILLLCSYYSPMSLFIPAYPLRFVGFLASWVAILLSGFRSMVAYSAVVIFLSTILRRKWSDLFGLFAGGILLLVILVGLQSGGVDLPYSAQRALSFIPFVDWDRAAAKAGEDSTQWRVDMWKMAWEDNRIIKDKVLGDGYGFSMQDFGAVMDVELKGGTGFIGASSQEAWLVRGSFHSGPLSTIRVVGMVGLFLFTLSLGVVAYKAWMLVQASRDTPFFAWSLYLGIPSIYTLVAFYLIFGAFNQALPGLCFGIGYLKLLNLSLAHWNRTEKKMSAAPISVPGAVVQKEPATLNL